MAVWMQGALWVLVIVFGLWIVVSAVRSGKPLRKLVSSGTQGLCALGLVNLLGAFTGVSLGYSWLATGTGLALGIPGVISLVLMDILWR